MLQGESHRLLRKLAQYAHRLRNETGMVESICLRCFETIARDKHEERLALTEAVHRCPNEFCVDNADQCFFRPSRG